MQLVIYTEEGESEFKFEYDEQVLEAAEAEESFSEPALYDGYYTEEFATLEAARTHRDFKLASVSGVPEVKTVMEKQCVKILGKKVCTRVPVLYRRTSRLTAYARISSGRITNDQVWNSVRSCVVSAAASAGIAAILASSASGPGGIAAAKATFTAALVGCLSAKGEEFAKIASDIRVDLFTTQEHGDWKRSS